MFPKIVHQIWLQGENKIPKKFQEYVKINKKLLPEYTHILWDEKKILSALNRNPVWKEKYNKFSYIHQKADFARYVILYYHGGIYIDIDAYVIKPLGPILDKYSDKELIVSKILTKIYEAPIKLVSCLKYTTCINNGIIISKKNGITLKKAIEEIVKSENCTINRQYCITTTTGPNFFSNFIEKNLTDKIAVVEPDIFEPNSTLIPQITKNTVIIHNHAHTWLPEIVGKIIFFARDNFLLMLGSLSILFVFLFNSGYTRPRAKFLRN